MSQTDSPGSETAPLSQEEMVSALFANLVVQQTNTALVLLGSVPNPETGERIQDLEAARLFIDQLEMLAIKTKGNLSKREEQLLQQSLTTLHMAFVEAVESPTAAPNSAPGSSPTPENQPATSPDSAAPRPEEHRARFSKKY